MKSYVVSLYATCRWYIYQEFKCFFLVDSLPIGYRRRINPRRAGLFTPPPPLSGFSRISQRRRFWYTSSYIFSTRVVKISGPGRSRSGHQVTSNNLTWEKFECSLAILNAQSLWKFQRLISVPASIKCKSRNFYIGHPRTGQFCDLSIIRRKMKVASFGRKPLETLSNINLQVHVTPWVGIKRTVIPRHVANVISGHERSPAVFRQ